jgi:hypothetical protein
MFFSECWENCAEKAAVRRVRKPGEKTHTRDTTPRESGTLLFWQGLEAEMGQKLLCAAGIIWAFAGNGDVVDMAFAQTRAGDADDSALS